MATWQATVWMSMCWRRGLWVEKKWMKDTKILCLRGLTVRKGDKKVIRKKQRKSLKYQRSRHAAWVFTCNELQCPKFWMAAAESHYNFCMFHQCVFLSFPPLAKSICSLFLAPWFYKNAGRLLSQGFPKVSGTLVAMWVEPHRNHLHTSSVAQLACCQLYLRPCMYTQPSSARGMWTDPCLPVFPQQP